MLGTDVSGQTQTQNISRQDTPNPESLEHTVKILPIYYSNNSFRHRHRRNTTRTCLQYERYSPSQRQHQSRYQRQIADRQGCCAAVPGLATSGRTHRNDGFYIYTTTKTCSTLGNITYAIAELSDVTETVVVEKELELFGEDFLN